MASFADLAEREPKVGRTTTWQGGYASATLTNVVIATNEFRGSGAGERTEYLNIVAWDRLAEVCGKFLSKGQLVDIEGRHCGSSGP
jgi:single-strand DNA-binding protein